MKNYFTLSTYVCIGQMISYSNALMYEKYDYLFYLAMLIPSTETCPSGLAVISLLKVDALQVSRRNRELKSFSKRWECNLKHLQCLEVHCLRKDAFYSILIMREHTLAFVDSKYNIV
jgi:hypothetical protein